MNNNLNIRIPTTAQLRLLEAAWIKACHPNWGVVLMEQAGLAAAEVTRSVCDAAASVVVFCGRGNNGGDGFVVARHLWRWNIPVTIILVNTGSTKEQDPESEAAINQRICESLEIETHLVGLDNLETARGAIYTSDVIVDALLGTGLDRDVEGIYAELIQLINESGLPVVSIDMPSGINSDTGKIMGVAVEANATVTFGHFKAGLLHYPGAENAGALTLVDIGMVQPENLPQALSSLTYELSDPLWWLVTAAQVQAWLPARPAASNKGTFGRLLCIAGSAGMTGSAVLASKTALRAGVGLSVLATASSIIRNLPAEEMIYHSLPETENGTLSLSAFDEIEKQVAISDAVIIGPGLTTNPETSKLILKLLSSIEKPCIVDADGLNAIAESKSGISFAAPENVILTPHPKELSRLLGMSVGEIQADRSAAAKAAVARFGCNIILKGANTVICTHDQQTFIITNGNAGMATAGAGDVLSGIVGAMLAQGLPAGEASVVAAYLHGAAGDKAAETHGEDGLIAGDIVAALPQVLSEMRSGQYVGTYIEEEALSLQT